MVEINNRWESLRSSRAQSLLLSHQCWTAALARSGAHNDKCKHSSEILSNAPFPLGYGAVWRAFICFCIIHNGAKGVFWSPFVGLADQWYTAGARQTAVRLLINSESSTLSNRALSHILLFFQATMLQWRAINVLHLKEGSLQLTVK